jgi:hypothetical protein
MSKLTPTSRIQAATKLLHLIESDSFLLRVFATKEEFLNYINADTSLDAIHNKIDEFRNNCDQILQLVQFAQEDCEPEEITPQFENLKKNVSLINKTLTNKLNWVKIREIEINLQKIERTQFIVQADLINYINTHFGTSWPLVLARDHIINLTQSLETSSKSIEHIVGDITEKDFPGMITACKELGDKTQLLITMLADKINVILKHPDYNFQVGFYEKHQEEELKARLTQIESYVGNLRAEVNGLRADVSSLRIDINNLKPTYQTPLYTPYYVGAAKAK